jgi:hypothetical protein
MRPGLSGTGRIADDLYLLAHSDVTGKPYIQPRPLGLGLAGGLLAELVLAGALVVVGEQVTVTGRLPSVDALAGQVLGMVAGERGAHPVPEWLAYLSLIAPAAVALRLASAGYLAQARRWPPWREGRWVPADRDAAFAPVIRVRAVLDASQQPVVGAVVLAGLAEACGLWFRLAEYTPVQAIRPLYRAVAQLTPGLQDLIAHTRVAVDSAVLAHRVGARR